MQEVKLRGEVIEGILTRQLTLIYDQPTVEALFLQLRLVLESIALGSLVAHQEDFDNMRAKMRAHHKPIGLLNALEKHHPKFYPEPVIQEPGEGMIKTKTNLVPRPDDYLTKTEFESCYGACSEYLHVTNPLVGDKIVLYATTDENGTAPDWEFDPALESWRELPDDPLGPGFNRSMVWNGEALFLFDKALVDSPGGADGPSYTRAARYQNGAWTALPTADTIGPGPELVDGHRLIAPVLGYADGGTNNNFGRCIPYGAVFDTTANEWSELPKAPRQGRKGIWVNGGVSDTDLVARSTRGPFFDATADEWFDLPPLDPETDPDSNDANNQTFIARRAASIGDAIMVVGGAEYGPGGGALLADAYIWTP
ncbi:MAG: hypothetical protein F4X68_01805 [Acidimicrobiia bacterium]|nr:hypothetical protein [Acidimicrobiia bacterium]MYB72688.1 hypothetical protein [Acidimicrobiia bacterium]